MEWILAQAGATAVSFATRGGYSLATHYAVKTVKKYLEKVPVEDRAVLEKTRQRLETKILIISPAIDLIQLISARGNTSLSTTVALTRELKNDIIEFQNDMDQSMEDASVSVGRVREAMDLLLKRVEEAIPLIQLALTTSGACLSSDLPNNVSPGRLLQAMDYVRQSEREWLTKQETGSRDVLTDASAEDPGVSDISVSLESNPLTNEASRDTQIGPTFSITSYTTFSSSSQVAWKEDMARAQLSLYQTQEKFHYYLKLEENFDDGRYHDDKPRVSEIDVSKITRLFFSASGKLLEIEDSKSPVLVVKINEADLEDEDEEDEEEKVTWLAIESWSRDVEEDDEEEDVGDYDNSFDMSVTEDTPGKSRVFESPVKREGGSRDYDNPKDFLKSRDFGKGPNSYSRDHHVSSLSNQLDALTLDSSESGESISLLEYLIRLLALQSNDQKSALEITDERLNLYLRDESRASDYEQSIPAVQEQRTMSRPIAPDTPVVLGGRRGGRGGLGHNLRPNVPSHVTGAGHVTGHMTQNPMTQNPMMMAGLNSVSRPTSAAPQTPLRNTQFSSFHTPNTKSAWEVDRVMRPSPLKRQN